MTDYPFTHKKAIKGAKSSFIFNKFVSSMIPILIKEKGILNVGVKKEIYMILQKSMTLQLNQLI